MGSLNPAALAVTERRLNASGLSFTIRELGEGPCVLLCHGFPDTRETWRLLMPRLADAGYHAVAMTMRGYEASSQPADGDYGIAALASDIAGVAAELGKGRVHLVGHDWGASAAFCAAAMAPEAFASLTALAVPHPGEFASRVMRDPIQLWRSRYVFAFQARGKAEGRIAANDFAYLERLWRRWSPGWTPDAVALASVKDAFAEPGVLQAALAYYRAALDTKAPGYAEGIRLQALPITIPTLGILGARDGCVLPRAFRAAMPASRFTAGGSLNEVAGAGHFLQLEKPDEVAKALIGHLSANLA